MSLAALRGRESEATALIQATFAPAMAAGQGGMVIWTRWATAILCNGQGRYVEAAAAAEQACQGVPDITASLFALPELVEAAARSGNTRLAAGAVDQLAQATRPGGTDWGLGVEARCRALVSQGPAAEDLYREAIGRLGRTRLRPELARAHLLYGEWLRRENRRTDAREQLRTAHDLLSGIGMDAFAERARRELALLACLLVSSQRDLRVQRGQLVKAAHRLTRRRPPGAEPGHDAGGVLLALSGRCEPAAVVRARARWPCPAG
jgi:hypothetical protein